MYYGSVDNLAVMTSHLTREKNREKNKVLDRKPENKKDLISDILQAHQALHMHFTCVVGHPGIEHHAKQSPDLTIPRPVCKLLTKKMRCVPDP